MPDLTLEFDAVGSNPDGTNPGTALALSTANGWSIAAFDAPSPELKALWTGGIDTDGDVRVDPSNYQNRTVTVELWQRNSTAALVETALGNLRGKLAKLNREGGTLKVTWPSGDVRFYDLAATGLAVMYDPVWVARNVVRVAVTLTAKPLARGAEVDLGDNSTTTLPYLSFTDSVTGEAGGLVRLVIDDDQAVDRRWVVVGLESANYSSSANADVFYQAEGRTALGGSAIAAGPSGASGTGSNVMRNTALTTSPQAIMSSQATGGGAHWSHVGLFNMIARVQVPTTNTGTVSVALEWAEGDYRVVNTNPTYTIDPSWEGTWQIARLGPVNLNKVTSGTQKWEARLLANSTVIGDDIDVDWIMLIPAGEGYGEASAVWQMQAPTSFTARDEFDQSAGALNAKTLPSTGTWAVTGGDATNAHTVETTGHTVQRSNPGGPGDMDPLNDGSFAIAGSTAYAATVTRIDVKIPGGSEPNPGNPHEQGVVARYVDASNWLMGSIHDMTSLRVRKRVAGTTTTIGTVPFVPATETWYTLLLAVTASGSFALWAYPTGSQPGRPRVTGADPVLATSAALDDGKPGFYDESGNITAARSYDNFAVWTFVSDAAIFASQSIEFRSDGVEREDSTGALMSRVASFEGHYPVAPPAGAEGRTLRVVIFASRSVPGQGPDAGLDDISARLFVRPRYL